MAQRTFHSSFLHPAFLPVLPSPAIAPTFDTLSSWPDDPFPLLCQWYYESELSYLALTSNIGVAWPNNVQLATVTDHGRPRVRNVLLKGLDHSSLLVFTNYDGAKGRELSTNPQASIVAYWKYLERQVRVEGRMTRASDGDNDDYFHARPIGSQVSACVSPQSRPILDRVAIETHYVREVERVAQAVHDVKANGSHQLFKPIEVKQLTPATSTNNQSQLQSQSSVNSDGDLEADVIHNAHARAIDSLNALSSDSSMSTVLSTAVARPPNWGGFRLQPDLIEFWRDGKFRLHSRIQYRFNQSSGQWDKQFLAP